MKIFFDVDGVLVDGWHVNPELRKPRNASIEADLGVNLSEFEHKFFIEKSNPLGSAMDACVAGQRDLKDALAEVLPQVGYQGHVEDFVHYWFEKDSNVSIEVLELVKTLSLTTDIELFIATGQEHFRAAYIWNKLRFSELFKQMFFSADIGYLKSDIRFFTTINSRLGVSETERPIFFDYREDVVMLAHQAGWDAVVFHTIEDIRSHPRLNELF